MDIVPMSGARQGKLLFEIMISANCFLAQKLQFGLNFIVEFHVPRVLGSRQYGGHFLRDAVFNGSVITNYLTKKTLIRNSNTLVNDHNIGK